jgi:hypothetical protein
LLNSKNIRLDLKRKIAAGRLLFGQLGAKDPKTREDHLIFINFGVKKFILKNNPPKKNFDI